MKHYPKGKGPDSNYDFKVQKEPKKNMGQGSFANMPDKPIVMSFSKDHQRRDGIINSFTADLVDVSDLHENYNMR